MPKTIVITGATDGMGRAFALERLGGGDRVVAIGSNRVKGDSLMISAGSGADRLRFVPADLSSVREVERVIEEIGDWAGGVDALLLFANRVSPRRIQTAEGFERTFALYYLSRYLLSHGLIPLMEGRGQPVIVDIAGVGVTKGAIDWDDSQLTRGYTMIRAQLQAGRANDLLGVAFAEEHGEKARFVLYHPGFTKSGDLSPLNPLVRGVTRALAAVMARPVNASIQPLHGFVDNPPAAPLTAVDRGKQLSLSLPTLDSDNARRLAKLTVELLSARP